MVLGHHLLVRTQLFEEVFGGGLLLLLLGLGRFLRLLGRGWARAACCCFRDGDFRKEVFEQDRLVLNEPARKIQKFILLKHSSTFCRGI